MATIRDVARAAGVSIATVSATLNGSGRASAATRERVWAAIEAIGYRPNAVARSLRLGTSRLIGMVVSDITNPFAGQLIHCAEETALAAGFSLIVCTTGDDERRLDAVLAQLCAQRVAGIIVAPPGSGPGQGQSLGRADLPPLVTIDNKVPGLARDFVGVDNRAMVRLLVEHLAALGHRRIAMISGRQGVWTADERCAGLAEALDAAGLGPGRCVRADYVGSGSGAAAARALLDGPGRPTAIIGANNVLALGILEACIGLGLRCPADLSIAGIDQVPWSGLVRPRITVVAQPVDAVAGTATAWLLERILAPRAAQAPRERLVAPSFLDGESCARPSGRSPVDLRAPATRPGPSGLARGIRIEHEGTTMSDNATTGQGTVKGHHKKPGDDVTEGGVPPAPTEGHGAPKASASKAAAEGLPEGGTSTATAGTSEKEHAAAAGARKTQSGRGHRKD